MAEPEWDEQTRELALAYDAVDLCRVCGGPAFLCQDPEMQDQWVGADPVRCHRQTAVLQRQKGVTEKTNPFPQALIFRAVLRGGPRGR